MKEISREWLVKNGFKNSFNERVYFREDVGYEFGFVNRAVVKHKRGFVLLKDIQTIDELQDLYLIVTGNHITE